MIDRDDIYNRYIRPFKLVEQLDLNCGYEKSFKLAHRTLMRNRYLLGIDKADLKAEQLSLICEQMGMPEQFEADFISNMADANLILLGFEEGTEDCIYKIYLEYWDNILAKLKLAQSPYAPVTMFLGYKWSAFNNARAALTNYTYYPRISLDQILRRLEKLNSKDDGKLTFDIVSKIIVQSARRANSESFIYLEASEANNPRKSFDINLYQAGINLKNIYPFLKELCHYYSIGIEELDNLYESVYSLVLGHLSGGIDREGNSFFTVYYETEPGSKR